VYKGLKFFKKWTLHQCLHFFNLLLLCTWSFATLKGLVGNKFERKNCCTIIRLELREKETQWKVAPLRPLVCFTFARNKNHGNQGLKFLKQWTLHQCLFFQLCACFHIKFGNVEAVGRLQFQKNNISRKGSTVENTGLIFTWNKNQNNYRINRQHWWVENFLSTEHCTILFIFSTHGACLCMKFSKIKAVSRLRIFKNKISRKPTALRPLLGLAFACIMNQNEYSIIAKDVILKISINIRSSVDFIREGYRQIDKLSFDLQLALTDACTHTFRRPRKCKFLPFNGNFSKVDLWTCKNSWGQLPKTHQQGTLYCHYTN